MAKLKQPKSEIVSEAMMCVLCPDADRLITLWTRIQKTEGVEEKLFVFKFLEGPRLSLREMVLYNHEMTEMMVEVFEHLQMDRTSVAALQKMIPVSNKPQ